MTPRSKYVSPCLMLVLLVMPLLTLPVSATTPARLTFKYDTITGTLRGQVLDANEAPIPGVLVRVINEDTGNDRATRTNDNGWYLFPILPLGRYRIEATKDGFRLKQRTKEPIKIQLNQTFVTAPPIILESESAAPTVAVTPPTPAPTPAPAPAPAATAMRQEEVGGRLSNQLDPTRRLNSDEQMVALLPLAGVRSFNDLALLAAGVAPPPEVKGVAGPGIGSGIGTPGQFAVNGLRARSNNFTVDGSDNNDEDVGVRRQGFVALVPQSIESVREMQIVTHLWDAEMGRSIGSQVNAVSKSGTNQIHGQVYDFFNHSALNARNFFDYSAAGAPAYRLTTQAYRGGFRNGQPVNTPDIVPVRIFTGFDSREVILANPSEGKDPFQRNQGGAVIGFPIFRDKTFFFGSFERQDVKARQETHFAVPTVAQRGFLGFGATGFSAPDPRTPVALVDFNPTFVAGDAVFSLFPFPNNPNGPYGENTLTQVLPADAHGLIYSLKLDHSFRLFGPEVSHNFTARYNFTDDERQVPAVGGAIFSGVLPQVKTHNLSLFLTSQFTSTLSNQLRASYGRTALVFAELRDPYLLQSQYRPREGYLLNAPALGNNSSPAFPLPFVKYEPFSAEFDAENFLGTIGQLVVTPFSPVGLDVYLFPQARANNTMQIADTLTLFRAGHTFKFGADIRRTQLNSFLDRNFRPQVVFGGSPDLTQRFPGLAPIPNITRFGPTPGYFSGSDLAALGIPTNIFQSLAIGTPDSTIGLRFWQFNYFFNDNWRARNGLSFDYGVRYELNTVPREVNARIENTFALDQLPAGDPTLSLAFPFTEGTQILNGQLLINAFNATVDALRTQLGGREAIFDPDRNNFGGHVGFVWDPLAGNREQAGKTAIRGGVGLYYDLTLGSVVSQSRNVFPNFLPLNIDANTFDYARQRFFVPRQTGIRALFNPLFVPVDVVRGTQLTRFGLIAPNELNAIQLPAGVLPQILGLLFKPDVAGVLPSGSGLAYTLPDEDLRSPMAYHFNLQIERELFRDLLLNVAYVGTRGVRLTRYRTPNGGPNSVTLPVDPLGLLPNPRFALAIAPLSNLDTGPLQRPNPSLGAYTIFDSSAASTYHSLQTALTKRFSQGYQMTAAYTWSHAFDDVSDVFDVAGAFALAQDDRVLRAEHASANFDIRHRFVLSTVGNLPLFERFNDDKGARGFLLGGWQFASLLTYQTGQPFTVNTSFDVNLDGNLTDRLDTLAGLTVVDDRRVKLNLNAAPTGLLAALGDNGRIGRNTFRASGVARTDLAVIKNFRLRGGHFLVFRAEAFNAWNRTHFAIPVRVLEAPSFGRSVDTLLNPRQIQFALKYVF